METIDKIIKAMDDYQSKRTFSETYEDVFLYAEKYGGVTSKAFSDHLTELLQDGYLPQAEAESTIIPALEKLSNDITTVAAGVQQTINTNSRVGLKAISILPDMDRIKGFVSRAISEPLEDVMWLFGEPITTFARSVVFDTQKENIEFQGKAGFDPKVTRYVYSKCCDWCEEVAGTYNYSQIGAEIFRGHDNCRCYVEYTANKKTDTVYTKRLKGKK